MVTRASAACARTAAHQVLGSVEVDALDLLGVWGAQDCREVENGRDALDGVRERVGLQQVAADWRYPIGKLFAGTDEATAVNACG